MKRYTRILAVGLALVFAAGCGSEGEQGPPGDTHDVTTERIEDHDQCTGGGVDILINDVVASTVCDGEDGVGDAPEVDTERHEDHADCPGGGVDIIVDGTVSDVICDGEDGEEGQAPQIVIAEDPEDCGDAGGVAVTLGDEDPFPICNGEDGAGEGGEVPEIVIGEPSDCGDAGGYSLTIGEEDPIDICNGEAGTGEGGSDVEIVELEPSDVGPCIEGGLEITVTDSDGNDETFVICGVSPIDPPEIGWCNTSYPGSIETLDIGSAVVYGQVYVEDFTGDQPATLPEDDFVAALGYVEAAADPVDDVDPTDGAWEWIEAELNEDFENGNNDEFMADFSEIDAGEYYYLYRMSVDGGDNWVYCGLDGDFDAGDYDASEDAGWMEVSSVEPGLLAGWDFQGANLSATRGQDGNAYAMFSDGDESDPVGSSTFFGGGQSHWAAAGVWITEDEFPPSDFEDLEYFGFYSAAFASFDEFTVNGEFRRTGEGPKQFQIVAEFDDGALAMLEVAVEITDADTNMTIDGIEVDRDDLVSIGDDPDQDASIVAFRIYGFEANNFGGGENMRVIDIEFEGL